MMEVLSALSAAGVRRDLLHAAAVLDTRARALDGSLDRLAVRDVPEQATALWQAGAGLVPLENTIGQVTCGSCGLQAACFR